MEITSDKVVTIKLLHSDVVELLKELDRVDFCDVDEPLLYRVWADMGKLK